MKKKPNPELIDDENPEWTEDDFKRAVSFSELPAAIQAAINNIRPGQSVQPHITVERSPGMRAQFKDMLSLSKDQGGTVSCVLAFLPAGATLLD